MSPLLALAPLVVAAGILAAPQPSTDEEGVYDRIFNAADADMIINNDRILDLYLKCFYSTGPCTKLGTEIKGKISEVMSDVCGKCTLEQKRTYRHCLDIFIPKRPKDWERILQIYDPDGAYWPGLKKFLEGPVP